MKQELWKQEMPEGFRAQKFVKGPDGEYKRDPTYVGETAWLIDTSESVQQIVAKEAKAGNLNEEERAELLGFLNEGREEKGLPLYNSDFKLEGIEVTSSSNDVTAAGQLLGFILHLFFVLKLQ